MSLPLTRAEQALLAATAILLLVALFAPPLAQPVDINTFADGRTLWGVPNALDVLSNVPFALFGGIGFAVLARVPRAALSPVQRGCAALFFAGLLVTTLGSSWYHLHPDDSTLLADRLSMAVAFAGVLGLAAASSISDRAGAALGALLFVAGPAAAAAWAYTGNVLPWAVVQFGGMPLILWCALRGPRAGGLPVGWFAVLLAYAVAKLFEANDAQVFALTSQWLGGHAIKHVVAALAALPVIAPLAALARRHNPANTLAARA